MTRTDIINWFVRERGLSRYLEIGVSTGFNFDRILCDEKTGVDPSPASKATIHETSDTFFSHAISARIKYDIIFIDGLHQYEQVYRDITNALQCLSSGGVIVLHDCLPWSEHVASHDYHGGDWCGDTYKAVARYFSESPFLCYTVDTDCGCGIIDTALPVAEKEDSSCVDFSSLSYSDFASDRARLLNVIGESEFVSRIHSTLQDSAAQTKKILFVTSARGPDYENDVLFHGLVKSGIDVTDSRYLWYMSSITHEQKLGLYGRGFTVYGKLKDRSGISRNQDEIRQRISDRYYDAVIYGSIHRCSDYLELVCQHYPKDRIALVDGEDHTTVSDRFYGKGVYFKRELVQNPKSDLLPITFAIPKEQFDRPTCDKRIDFAEQLPGIRGNNYSFFDEDSYYRSYAESRFALTWKKGGWDCMRHYEIVAAGTVPLFPGVEHCPSGTMSTWPMKLQIEANNIAYSWITGVHNTSEYDRIRRELVTYAKKNLTTERLSRYVLRHIGL